MSLNTIALVWVAFVGSLLSCTTSVFVPEQEINNLVYLGTVEGKSFFVENTLFGGWKDAQQYCWNSSMQLAKITTATQNNLLLNARNQSSFPSGTGYWTAGRDSLTVSQFVWDSTGEPLSSTYYPELRFNSDVTTCLYWNNGKLNTGPCTTIWYFLCEVVHGDLQTITHT